jgi:DMSO/TMAO reductase YedYZ molybdopterin-dependent catalytic subunit
MITRHTNQVTHKKLELRNDLPMFPSPFSTAWSGLRIDGLVKAPVTLRIKDLSLLPTRDVLQDFQCEEGWVAVNQHWNGVPVSVLLALSEADAGARYVRFSAGDFSVVLPVEQANGPETILALRLRGQPLAAEHGGPCRLVAPGKECFYGVKWVDRITALAEPAVETGRTIALQRLAGNNDSKRRAVER